MTRPLLSTIRDHVVRAETSAAALDFYSLARIEALSKGRRSDARRIADEQATQRVQGIQEKAEPGAIGCGSPQWGKELSEFRQIVSGFVAELAHVGAFDAALPDMLHQPLRTRFAISTTAISGSETAEGQEKPISQLAFTNAALEARKAAAIVVLTEELARLAQADVAIGDALRRGIAAATDASFLSYLIALTTPVASTGSVLNDLAALFASVPTGFDSRFYFVVTPAAAAQLAFTSGTTGRAFADMTPLGGQIGLQVLVSDQLQEGQAVLFDAASIAATSEAVTLSSSGEAIVDLGDSPGVPSSLWQRDLVAVKAERWYGFAALRSNAVASLSGATYSWIAITMTRGNIAMMSQSELAQALAELSVAAYRGRMPPESVLRALEEIVALASKGKATKAPAKRTRVTKRTIKGHAGNGAAAHEAGKA